MHMVWEVWLREVRGRNIVTCRGVLETVGHVREWLGEDVVWEAFGRLIHA